MKRIALSSIVMVAVVVFVATAALAATSAERCLGGLAKAQGRYQSCVQKAHAKLFGGGSENDFDAAVSNCRTKYAAAWDKLVALNMAPCAGSRWVDNGTTVTDNLTGLVWEKKTNLDSIPNAGDRHDADNGYTWTTSGDGDSTDEDGTAFTDFLANLNADGGFDGANGWRLPTVAELVMILLPETYPCATSPCIDSSFGPTNSSSHWSATTFAYPEFAWDVDFIDGKVNFTEPKDSGGIGGLCARAVRGGL